MTNKATAFSHTPTPIVSIIIPVYNDEKHVARAIESALNQTMREVEVIVVKGGTVQGLGPHNELLKTSTTYQKLCGACQRPGRDGSSDARRAFPKATHGRREPER